MATDGGGVVPPMGAGGSARRVKEKRHGLPEGYYAATSAKHAPPQRYWQSFEAWSAFAGVSEHQKLG